MGFLLGLILGIVAMIGLGMNNSLAKLPSKKLGPYSAIFFRNLFTSILLLVIFIATLPLSTINYQYIGITFLISIVGFIPLIAIYKSMQHGKLGVIMPIGNTNVFFAVALAMVFLGERLSAMQAVAIVLILAGVFLISVNFKDWKKSELFSLKSGVPYALVAGVFWGLYGFLVSYPIGVIGPILTSLIIEIGILAMCFTYLKLSRTAIKIPDRKTLSQIVWIALFAIIGGLSFTFGMKEIGVSLISAISGCSPLVAAIYGWIAFKERLSIQQYAAFGMIVIGIVLIAF